MKTKFIPTLKMPLFLLLIFASCILPMKLGAQNNSDQDAKDEGIVMYSDTELLRTTIISNRIPAVIRAITPPHPTAFGKR